MKDLRRLRGETGDAFEEELLGSWRVEGPSASSRDRAWASLAGGLGVAVGASAAGGAGAHAGAGFAAGQAGSVAASATTSATATTATTAATATKAAWGVTTAVKLLILGAGTSAAIATTTVAVRTASRHPTATHEEAATDTARTTRAQAPQAIVRVAPLLSPPVPAAEPVAVSPPQVAISANTTVVHVPVPTNATQVAAPSSAVTSDDQQIGRQVAALDAAREALAAGDAPRALHLLDAYDNQFPGGALATEAMLVRVKALLTSGDRAQATALGRRFIAEHASSPYATQVTEMLGTPN
jgi:Outer membrane lipoprotein